MSDTLNQEIEKLSNTVYEGEFGIGYRTALVEVYRIFARHEDHKPSEILGDKDSLRRNILEILNGIGVEVDDGDFITIPQAADSLIRYLQPYLREPKREARPAGEIPVNINTLDKKALRKAGKAISHHIHGVNCTPASVAHSAIWTYLNEIKLQKREISRVDIKKAVEALNHHYYNIDVDTFDAEAHAKICAEAWGLSLRIEVAETK